MTYTYTGKIIAVGKLEEGLSGTIKRRIQVILQDKTSSLAMWIFNDNIEKFLIPVEIGDEVNVEFSVKSRQWKEGAKWETSCYCLSMSKVEQRKRQERASGGHRTRYRSHQATTRWFTGCQTAKDIKDRYRELCKLHHSDVTGGSDEIMKEINVEYNRLKS